MRVRLLPGSGRSKNNDNDLDATGVMLAKFREVEQATAKANAAISPLATLGRDDKLEVPGFFPGFGVLPTGVDRVVQVQQHALAPVQEAQTDDVVPLKCELRDDPDVRHEGEP